MSLKPSDIPQYARLVSLNGDADFMFYRTLEDAVGRGEKREIFKVSMESLGQFIGKYEAVEVKKPGRKVRAKKIVDYSKSKIGDTVSTPKKRKYTKKAKYWGKKK